jgi:hypothetical protein
MSLVKASGTNHVVVAHGLSSIILSLFVKVPLDITHKFKHRSMNWFEFRKRKVQEGGGERDTGKSRSAVILQDALQ